MCGRVQGRLRVRFYQEKRVGSIRLNSISAIISNILHFSPSFSAKTPKNFPLFLFSLPLPIPHLSCHSPLALTLFSFNHSGGIHELWLPPVCLSLSSSSTSSTSSNFPALLFFTIILTNGSFLHKTHSYTHLPIFHPLPLLFLVIFSYFSLLFFAFFFV